MSTLFGILFILWLVSIPGVFFPLLTIVIIRAALKKPVKKWVIAMVIYVGSIIPIAISLLTIGVLTDPGTWCDHQYEILEDVAPTCTKKGERVNYCPLCKRKTYEYFDMVPHSWGEAVTVVSTCTQQGYTKRVCSQCLTEDIAYTDKLAHSWETDSIVGATCTSEGYTVEKCTGCSITQRTNTVNALGHSMREAERIEPTYDNMGKIIKKCERCDHEETETLDKLEPVVIKFSGLELTFKGYSFTEVGNKYSDYYGQTVVKIPVTVKNISNEPNALNYYYYTLFGSEGIESANVGYYFDDDMMGGGELLPEKSFTRYFHILYDGDGVYTLVFDDMLFEKKTVEIVVQKSN